MRHPRLIAVLIGIILSPITLEIALQLIDPLRAKPYFADLALLFGEATSDDTRGYVLPAGAYRLSNWTATILDDHTRLVPDTHDADCSIAFVGDSVTFAYGVDDTETWVNVLAQHFPRAQLINAGVPAYNASQVEATIKETRASGFFYTLVSNDAGALFDWRHPIISTQPILPVYLYILSSSYNDFEPDYTAFDAALGRMKAMPNVMIVGFEGDALAQRAGVPTVPMWTQSNSRVDSHANAEGNQVISAAMQPYVEQVIEETCPT